MGEEARAPLPRSPPRYPDLCGRRRLQLEVQILNRELGFLEVRTPYMPTTNLAPACLPACLPAWEFIIFRVSRQWDCGRGVRGRETRGARGH
jgi:hypothetical protein